MTNEFFDRLARARVHDLSFPIGDHFKWPIDREVIDSLAKGDAFESSRFSMSAHGFTHADAPSHVVVDGQAVDALEATTWIGSAAIVDVSDLPDRHPIAPADLDPRAGHVVNGDILLLRTAWDSRTPIESRRYWEDAPYLTRAAAEWIAARGVRCVGFDFPQDHAIRLALAGEKPEPADFVTHDVLLRNGIGLLEYLCNLHGIESERVYLVAAPIRLSGSDGGPARAIAIEEQPTPQKGQYQ